MNTKIYVGNLSYDTTKEFLLSTFAAHGTVLSVDLITDRVINRPRGFAFVTMESNEGAMVAMSALNGTDLDGRQLIVNEARKRVERSSGNDSNNRYSSNSY